MCNAQPAAGLDGLSASAAVGPGPGEYDGDRAFLLLARQGAEEIIDRVPMPLLLDRLAQPQHAVLQRHSEARANHIDVVGLHAHSVLDLLHRHGSAAAQNLGHQTMVLGRKMLDDHIGHPAIGRGRGKEIPERLHAPGRGPNPHHPEGKLRAGSKIDRGRNSRGLGIRHRFALRTLLR